MIFCGCTDSAKQLLIDYKVIKKLIVKYCDFSNIIRFCLDLEQIKKKIMPNETETEKEDDYIFLLQNRLNELNLNNKKKSNKSTKIEDIKEKTKKKINFLVKMENLRHCSSEKQKFGLNMQKSETDKNDEDSSCIKSLKKSSSSLRFNSMHKKNKI